MKPWASKEEHQCDILWQRLQVKRWKAKCGICGSTRGTSGHHLIKRRHMEYRHDPRNGILLCFGCHEMAETRQQVFLAKLKAKHPDIHTWLQEANRKALKPCPPVLRQDMVTRLEMLKSMVATGCGTSS